MTTATTPTPTKAVSTYSKSSAIRDDPADNPYTSQITLHSLVIPPNQKQDEEADAGGGRGNNPNPKTKPRTVTFAQTVAPPDAPVVLFWYAAGGGRRMLLHLCGITKTPVRLICINRPGKDGTSHATATPHGLSATANHVATTCSDAVAVMDALGLAKVHILAECAGTPFSLAFCAANPNRVSTVILVGPWVQPADCSHQKTLYKIGAACPALISPVVAGSMNSFMGLFQLLSSPDKMPDRFRNKALDESERAAWDARVPDDMADRLQWAFGESGGMTLDLHVLLSAASALELDYSKVLLSSEIQLFHAVKDKITPYVAVEWLAEQLPNASLTAVPNASHEGMLFLLHDETVQALDALS